MQVPESSRAVLPSLDFKGKRKHSQVEDLLSAAHSHDGLDATRLQPLTGLEEEDEHTAQAEQVWRRKKSTGKRPDKDTRGSRKKHSSGKKDKKKSKKNKKTKMHELLPPLSQQPVQLLSHGQQAQLLLNQHQQYVLPSVTRTSFGTLSSTSTSSTTAFSSSSSPAATPSSFCFSSSSRSPLTVMRPLGGLVRSPSLADIAAVAAIAASGEDDDLGIYLNSLSVGAGARSAGGSQNLTRNGSANNPAMARKSAGAFLASSSAAASGTQLSPLDKEKSVSGDRAEVNATSSSAVRAPLTAPVRKRREAHNATEQRRREKINTCIDEIKVLCGERARSLRNKATILSTGADYMRELIDEVQHLRVENAMLREQVVISTNAARASRLAATPFHSASLASSLGHDPSCASHSSASALRDSGGCRYHE